MKKFICLALLTGCVDSIFTMDNQLQPDQNQLQNSGFSVFDYVSSAGNWFKDTLDSMDQALGTVASPDQQKQQDADAEHLDFVRQELGKKPLSQAIVDATQQPKPNQFFSLLIGMEGLELRASKESETVIRNYLTVLKDERRQKTKALLAIRMAQEKEVHDFTKKFARENENFSDDEGYSDPAHFVGKLISDK